MILGLFRRRKPNAELIDALYGAVAEAARQPAFYRDLGVADTFEGRFDLLTLHAILVLDRLRALPDPAGDLARDLVDAVFAAFDAALRELGVSDIGVPKRMKQIAGAFYGRARAYEAAFAAGEPAVAAALHRNVYGSLPERGADAGRLAAYVLQARQSLRQARFEDIAAARLEFPQASRFGRECEP